ncbi:MAG: hypothetical protein R2725_07285 [Solirubrobacterales bacterium]
MSVSIQSVIEDPVPIEEKISSLRSAKDSTRFSELLVEFVCKPIDLIERIANRLAGGSERAPIID